MLKSSFLLAFAMLALSPLVIPNVESSTALLATPLPPDTGTKVQTDAPAAPVKQTPTSPARLLIPSISLNDAITTVGLNVKGEMDVPDGSTRDVGWYGAGTVPGIVGSAVLDAHVFAAFSKLQNIKVGNSIYVMTDSGQKLHFVVSEMKTYALANVPADTLFNRADTERLNLITCAGHLTPDHTTYDHRLVVYATLVHDA